MKSKRKRILLVASAAICMAVVAFALLYDAKRTIVIEVNGERDQPIKAAFVVDGRKQTQDATLPTTFNFTARQVSFRIIPAEKSATQEIAAHAYTEDKWAEFTAAGWGTGGYISCPNILRNDPGGYGLLTYLETTPTLADANLTDVLPPK